jgi:hypothetical protein
MERLTAEQQEPQPASAAVEEPAATTSGVDAADVASPSASNDQPTQAPLSSKQRQSSTATAQQQLAVALQRLRSSVRIHLLTGDLRRALASRPGLARSFAAATVGHRHVHLLGPEQGLAGVLRNGAPVLVETAHNLVQLSTEQGAAFEAGVLQLAEAAGFVQHPAFSGGHQQPEAPSSAAAAAAAAEAGMQQQATASSWRLPPGHLALALQL